MNSTLLAFVVAAVCAATTWVAFRELAHYCRLHSTRDPDEEFP